MNKIVLVLLLAAAVLSGCGGGGSGSSETPGNLKVSDITRPDGDIYAGHGISLNYKLDSDKVFSNVVVNFYIVRADEFAAQEDDETTPHAEQYYLGSDTTAVVNEGENRLTAEFVIPDGVTEDADYFVIAQVDPDDEISETNEDDNTYASSDARSRAAAVLLSVNTSYKDVSNIIVKELVLDDASVILEQADLSAPLPELTDLTAEYPVYGSAHLNGYATVAVEGKSLTAGELNQLKVKAQVNINGTWTDLYCWSSDDNRYAQYTSFHVQEPDTLTLNADEIHKNAELYTIHFEVNIPASAALTMLNQIVTNVGSLLDQYNYFDVRIAVDTDNALAELNEDDNYYTVPVKVYSFPNLARASSDYLLEKDYSIGAGDKSKVRLELNMYAKDGLETGPKYGAIMKNEISMPIYAFNKSKTLFSIKDQHSAYVNSLGDTGYSNEIEFFGVVLVGDEQWADSITVTYEKSWDKDQIFATADLYVGPVPLTMETGLRGSYGIVLSATLSADASQPILSLDNDLPTMDFSLYAQAGVGNSIFSAGPIVSLILINEVLNFYNYATMDYTVATDHLNSASTGMTISNDIEAIRGKFGVYVRYPTVKWCKKWGVHYPCGTKRVQDEKYYYRTDALIDKKSTLYDNDKTWSF